MSKIPALKAEGAHFNIVDKEKFLKGIDLIKDSISCKGATLWNSDNMILWNKNYSMLRDSKYLEYLESPETNKMAKAIIWRTYVLDFLLKKSLKVEGDVLELGVLAGDTAYYLSQKFAKSFKERRYYLIDLFNWEQGDAHVEIKKLLQPDLFQEVRDRFKNYNFVEVTQGNVVKVLPTLKLNNISFAHIDMNNAEPESFCLEYLTPRMSRGGCIVLDDYGWWGYSEQKVALDEIANKYNLDILELPTGQGVIFF